jgi:LCP family protein required for cell wall assembly
MGGEDESRRGFGRFLSLVTLGALVPGVGLIATGRRVAGWIVLGAWAGLVAGMLFGVLRGGKMGLVAIGSSPSTLRVVGISLLVLAVVWLISAAVSLYLLQQPSLTRPQRFAGAVAVIAVMSLVITPLVTLASHSRTQTQLINRVFASGDQTSLTAPTEKPDVADPWAGRPTVNVLLLGGDGGVGRDGVRPDTVILASVDTATGRTVLLSLPRNLQRVPFPEDSPLYELYPDGFTGAGDPNEWLLNAIYQTVPAIHPDVFEDSSFAGADATKWAVEGALGVDVDYFVLVNLDGFKEIVDALGGITIDVHYRIPRGSKLDERTGRCTEPRDWIEPGLNQRLDGARALWYARARCGPPPVTDDYNRMERQRCVIGAIIDEAQPMTLLRHYRRVAGALEDVFLTDIPQTLLPAFADLATRVQESSVSSVTFTDEVISPSDPDYELLHELVEDALENPAPEAVEATAAAGPAAAKAPDTEKSAPDTPDPSTSPPADADDGGDGDEDDEDGGPAGTPEALDAVC